MISQKYHHSERREHFRINDSLLIRFKAIKPAEADLLGHQLVNNGHSEASQHQVQIRSLQMAFTLVTDQINHYDREVAKALRILNEKINLIEQSIHNPGLEQKPSQTINVNLSGGGLAFLTEQQLAIKSPVNVTIELHSSGVIIQALANVISCNKAKPENNQTPFYLRLAFTKMSEQGRDFLIKHVLFRQAEELRANNTFNKA
jgi:hypothetical protein